MKPLALTMGDPAGIGPEITAKAYTELAGNVPFVLVGDPEQFVAMGHEVAIVSSPSEATQHSALPIIPLTLAQTAIAGTPSSQNAGAVIAAIETAVTLTLAGECSGVVTNPISKKVLRDGDNFPWPGHTEFLAHLTGADLPVMMLAGPDLRVIPVTIHIPLAEVPAALSQEQIEHTIRIAVHDLKARFGLAAPRVAVAGLNPHAGEGGLMGVEDAALIAPVVTKLAEEGLTVVGPLPADTMFHARARQAYDVAVCMYHDQALIPVKTLNFDEGVNVTLGLPIIRTSPDHGTAFDIAGKGIADPSSLIAALKMAAEMAQA